MRYKIFSLFLLPLMGIMFTSCESQPSEKQGTEAIAMPSVPAVVGTPLIKDVMFHVETVGTIRPALVSEIRPEINGVIKEIFVKESQWVQQGDPIFQIEPKPFLLKMQEAEAQLAIDQANLESVQKKLNRLNELVQKDLVSRAEREELESQEEITRASIELDKVRLNQIKYDLERCLQKAPINGRVGKIDAYSGLLIINGQNESIITISKMDPLIVEFNLTEKEASQITMPTQIKIETLNLNQIKEGNITFLDNHFDSKTGLIMVRARIQNADFAIRPGQVAVVQIPISTVKNAKLIPQKAIKYNQQGPYVYVIDSDSIVGIRQIVLGEEYQNDQIVLDGLEATEQIVIDGHLRLFPGLKIEPKPFIKK